MSIYLFCTQTMRNSLALFFSLPHSIRYKKWLVCLFIRAVFFAHSLACVSNGHIMSTKTDQIDLVTIEMYFLFSLSKSIRFCRAAPQAVCYFWQKFVIHLCLRSNLLICDNRPKKSKFVVLGTFPATLSIICFSFVITNTLHHDINNSENVKVQGMHDHCIIEWNDVWSN